MFEVSSSDLVNMGITVVSYTIKDIRDDEVSLKRKYNIFTVLYFRAICMRWELDEQLKLKKMLELVKPMVQGILQLKYY